MPEIVRNINSAADVALDAGAAARRMLHCHHMPHEATGTTSSSINWDDVGTGIGFGWLFGILILVLVVLAIAAMIKDLRK